MRKSQFLKIEHPLESFNLHCMHMKVEINHPENTPPPTHRNLSPEQTQHHGNNHNPSRKNPKHFRNHLHPSRKNLNLPDKLLLAKYSITITETISNTQTNSQPLPEKSQPLVKNYPRPEKISTPPEKISTPPKKIATPPEKISTPPEKISIPPEKCQPAHPNNS